MALGKASHGFVRDQDSQGLEITPESIVRALEMSLARIIEANYADLPGSATENIVEFKSMLWAGKSVGLLARHSAGGQAEHKVPPLRFAPVGMTELFRCPEVAGNIALAQRARQDGARRRLVWERKTGCRDSSLGVSGFAGDSAFLMTAGPSFG